MSTNFGTNGIDEADMAVRTAYLSPTRPILTPEFKIRPAGIPVSSSSPIIDRPYALSSKDEASLNAYDDTVDSACLSASKTLDSESLKSSLAAFDREAFDTELIDPAMVDRYGFLIKDLQDMALHDQAQLHSQEKKEKLLAYKENVRAMKWVKMLKKLEKYQITLWSRKSKKVPIYSSNEACLFY
jgi:hypothetical protein